MNRRDYEYDIPWIFIMKTSIIPLCQKVFGERFFFSYWKYVHAMTEMRTGRTDRPKWVHHTKPHRDLLARRKVNSILIHFYCKR